MAKAAELAIVIRANDQASKKLDTLSGKMKKMGQTFQKTGLIMMGVGVAMGGALILLAKKAAEFEKSMREVNTMMGLGAQEFKEFSKEVRELAVELGVNAVDSAQALYQAISAGVPKENVLDFMRIATKAAIGGVTDTETAVDGLTTVINAFKLNISKAQMVADVMFTAVKGGKTTFEELSASIGMVAPAAAAMGVGVKDLFAAFATLTKQGIDTARASTSLNAVMTALIKPTEEMRTAIKDLGFSSADALIKTEGFASAISLLTSQAGGSKEMLGKMFGSAEALKAIFGLTGESAALFAADLDAMAESAGAGQAAFEEMEESSVRGMERLKSSLDELGLSIGDTILPMLADMLDQLKPIIDKMSEWVTQNEGLFVTMLKVAGVLIGAGGLLVIFGMIANAIVAINAALILMHGLMGPAGWLKLAAGLAFAGAGIAAMMAMQQGVKSALTTNPPLGDREPGTPPPASLFDNIPSLVHGGVVPGLIGAPIPIIAHGGEQFAGVGNSIGRAGPVNIYIGSFMGDESSLRAFSRKLQEIMAQDGRRTSFPGINSLGYMAGSSSV